MTTQGGQTATKCELRTIVWRGKGAQRVRITPLQIVPIHSPPPADEPASLTKPGDAGEFAEWFA